MRVKKQVKDFSILEKRILSKGLCTACGTCVGVCPRGILDIGWVDGDAEPYLAKPPCPECGICVKVCPRKDIPLLQLEEMAFGRKRAPDRDKVGVYQEAFSVHGVDVNVRENGAAGGAATALLAFALDKGVIDAAERFKTMGDREQEAVISEASCFFPGVSLAICPVSSGCLIIFVWITRKEYGLPTAKTAASRFSMPTANSLNSGRTSFDPPT